MNENEKSAKETIETWLKENDVEEFMERKAPKEDVLSEAHRIIYGDREKTYGHPSKNLQVTANFWGEYLGTKITAKDVCVMMMLLKIARLRNDINHRDSVVDTCGYAALIERCDE
jgi:translation initiation factor 2 alpha subunit (eIF-2alpha)